MTKETRGIQPIGMKRAAHRRLPTESFRPAIQHSTFNIHHSTFVSCCPDLRASLLRSCLSLRPSPFALRPSPLRPSPSDILRPLLYGFLISRLPDGACRRGDVSFAGRDRADDRGALP